MILVDKMDSVMVLLDSISDAAWISEGGIIKTVNDRFRQLMMHRHVNAMEGAAFWDLIGHDPDQSLAQWFEVWRRSGSLSDSLSLRRGSGEEAGPRECVHLFRLGTVELGLLTTQEDPDQNQKVTRHIAHDLLAILLDKSNTSLIVGALLDGPAIRLVHVDDKALELLDLDRQDIDSFDLLSVVRTDGRNNVARTFRQAIDSGTVQSLEVDIVSDAEPLDIEMTVGPMMFKGQPSAFAVLRDVTAGAVLVSELRRYAAAFEALQDTVVLGDEKFRILYVNPAGLKRSGYKLDEVIGRPLSLFAALREDEEDPTSAEQMLLRTGHWHGQRWAKRKDGAQYPVDIIATLQRDGDGSISTVTIVSRDISELRANETILLRARERAEFLRDLMSHDINNYIQGVIGRLDLLSRTGLSPQQDAHLREAMAQARRTSELVARVRNLALAQQAKALAAIPLGQTMDECVRNLRLKYTAVPIDVRVRSPLAEIYVLADELFVELVANIMDNAVKHSANRPVVLEVSAEPRWIGNRLFWRLAIADNGPGVPDADKETLFFQRVRKAVRDDEPGLGLSLVLALVERYSGRIWIEDRVPSDPSRGAKFVMELPAG